MNVDPFGLDATWGFTGANGGGIPVQPTSYSPSWSDAMTYLRDAGRQISNAVIDVVTFGGDTTKQDLTKAIVGGPASGLAIAAGFEVAPSVLAGAKVVVANKSAQEGALMLLTIAAATHEETVELDVALAESFLPEGSENTVKAGELARLGYEWYSEKLEEWFTGEPVVQEPKPRLPTVQVGVANKSSTSSRCGK